MPSIRRRGYSRVDGTGACAVTADQLLVLTTCEQGDKARELAEALVATRCAACVNLIDGVSSVYRWKDAIEQGSEVLLLIKTTADRYAAVEKAIRDRSNYELPEIIAVGIERGLPAYLDWIAAAVEP
jgi:periplasmic divalent cation tolerance protein